MTNRRKVTRRKATPSSLSRDQYRALCNGPKTALLFYFESLEAARAAWKASPIRRLGDPDTAPFADWLFAGGVPDDLREMPALLDLRAASRDVDPLLPKAERDRISAKNKRLLAKNKRIKAERERIRAARVEFIRARR